jgi:hypothetical protein
MLWFSRLHAATCILFITGKFNEEYYGNECLTINSCLIYSIHTFFYELFTPVRQPAPSRHVYRLYQRLNDVMHAWRPAARISFTNSNTITGLVSQLNEIYLDHIWYKLDELTQTYRKKKEVKFFIRPQFIRIYNIQI